MVHMNIMAEAWEAHHVMKSSMVLAGHLPAPSPQFHHPVSYYDDETWPHWCKTDNVGCQQADSAQGPTHCPYLFQ